LPLTPAAHPLTAPAGRDWRRAWPLLLALAALFFSAGTLGLLRLPDTLSRIHALTKADNLGLGLAALALLLPLPIPFTNSFPAWTILLLAGGLLERDGIAILLGYVVAAAGVLYFMFLGGAAAELVEALVAWLRS